MVYFIEYYLRKCLFAAEKKFYGYILNVEFAPHIVGERMLMLK